MEAPVVVVGGEEPLSAAFSGAPEGLGVSLVEITVDRQHDRTDGIKHAFFGIATPTRHTYSKIARLVRNVARAVRFFHECRLHICQAPKCMSHTLHSALMRTLDSYQYAVSSGH